MPGFNIGGSGGERGGPSNTIETLRNNRWRIIQLGNIVTDPEVCLVAQSFTPPNPNIDAREIQGAQHVYKFAEKVSWDDCSVVFYDTENVLPKLEEWMSQVYTINDGIKSHTQYKQQSIFSLLDGMGDPLRRHVLHGSWPKKIAHAEMSYTSSDIKLVTITIAYDWAETS